MTESFVFYKSFFEAAQCLEEKEQLRLYNAIGEYALNGVEPELTGGARAVFCVIKPVLDSNRSHRENGKKGGRPKKTIEIGTGSILFKKTKKDSMNINKFHDHLFKDHWKDRLSKVFNEYKDYNGISESNMTEEKKEFIKELFKKGLICL